MCNAEEKEGGSGGVGKTGHVTKWKRTEEKKETRGGVVENLAAQTYGARLVNI